MASLREQVRDRAQDRCEYCHLRQSKAPFLTFHLEHIRARQHGGADDISNRALACPDCNAAKGTNQAAYDPESDALVPLFNPRVQTWDEELEARGPIIVGRTAMGRATVQLLRMNDRERVEMRAAVLDSQES
jgi:hypothetical protein